MLVSSLDYNEFVGRIAVGRIERGTIRQNEEIAVCNYHSPDAAPRKAKAVSLYEFSGLAKVPVTEATAGNIIAMSGIGDVTIGDTICAAGVVEPLPFVKISAPTMEMTFSVNNSPFAGREGKFVTSRQIRDRLYRETLEGRFPARHGRRGQHRQLQRCRTRRNVALDPHRDDAPRRV